MSDATLVVAPDIQSAIWSHLLSGNDGFEPVEQAAFGFAKITCDQGSTIVHLVDWVPIEPEGFSNRSGHYIELTDEMRATLIKRAHNLQASLIELHSHPFSSGAEFSPSDLFGFEEFVPHVWWRLKGRPYLAIVVAPTGFDGIAWLTDPRSPVPLREVLAGDTVLRRTGRTLKRERFKNAKRPI